MQSKITGGETTYLFTAKILGKHDVKYFRCNDTGFIQTEEPYWLDEAYSSAITKLDVGLVYRNINLSNTLDKLLITHFNYKGRFLDYAGGYGLFTRLMRDKGFDFFSTDKFCTNIFAEYFDLQSLPPDTRFEAVTSFEVFEHLVNPIEDIKRMLEFSDTLFFTTELQPSDIKDVSDWPYFSTETGQHIAFYNLPSLKYLAERLGYNFYTDNYFLHLFTKKTFDPNLFLPVRDKFMLRKAKKFVKNAERKEHNDLESLLLKDWQAIKDKLNKSS